VTLRASPYQTYTDDEGEFILAYREVDGDQEITAWAPGYYISSQLRSHSEEDLELVLRKYHQVDHPNYAWVIPTVDSSEDACGNCHPMILSQWERNAHSHSISNPRFYSFYNGTDVSTSQQGLRGYLTDFPGTTGNCANCHAPGAAIDKPFQSEMNENRDEISAGIHCDFCHKVSGIYLDPINEDTFPNVPGVLGMEVLRPPEGEQIFIGPYPDIHDPDTYQPIFSESAFCATCHQFSFWGTRIYNSYGEWLESDYASQGITCQDCHMPPSGDTIFALPQQGGLEHDPEVIPSHFQLGIQDDDFMRESLQLEASYELQDGRVLLEVKLTNVTAGHHLPTDFPGRHLILLVNAETLAGETLSVVDGPELPEWAGDFAGDPGECFAKILQDALSQEYPVVSYWSPTLLHSDNRLQANETRTIRFSFERAQDDMKIHIQVFFRRLFQPIAEEYGWDMSELLLGEEEIVIHQ
jgi:nitrate/TMAO reductase-like tetraheme cytochrome c subunit